MIIRVGGRGVCTLAPRQRLGWLATLRWQWRHNRHYPYDAPSSHSSQTTSCALRCGSPLLPDNLNYIPKFHKCQDESRLDPAVRCPCCSRTLRPRLLRRRRPAGPRPSPPGSAQERRGCRPKLTAPRLYLQDSRRRSTVSFYPRLRSFTPATLNPSMPNSTAPGTGTTEYPHRASPVTSLFSPAPR